MMTTAPAERRKPEKDTKERDMETAQSPLNRSI